MTPWIQEFGWRYGLTYFLLGLLCLGALTSTLRAYFRATHHTFHSDVADALRGSEAGEQDSEEPIVITVRQGRQRVLMQVLGGAALWTALAGVSFALCVSPYYLYRAQSSVEGHNYDQAVREFQRARRADPMASQLYNGFQRSIAQEERHTDSVLDASESRVRLHGSDPAAHSDLGNVLMQHNQVERAIQEYRFALSLKPDYALVHNNLGNALKAHHQGEEAIREYRQAIALEADNPVYHCSLARIYAAQNAIPEALREYRKAVDCGPEFVPSYLPLAVLLHQTGQRQEAIATLEQLRKRLQKEPQAQRLADQVAQTIRDWRSGQ